VLNLTNLGFGNPEPVGQGMSGDSMAASDDIAAAMAWLEKHQAAVDATKAPAPVPQGAEGPQALGGLVAAILAGATGAGVQASAPAAQRAQEVAGAMVAQKNAQAVAEHEAKLKSAVNALKDMNELSSGVRMLLQARPGMFSAEQHRQVSAIALPHSGIELDLVGKTKAGEVNELTKFQINYWNDRLKNAASADEVAFSLNQVKDLVGLQGIPESSWDQIKREGPTPQWVWDNMANAADLIPHLERTGDIDWTAARARVKASDETSATQARINRALDEYSSIAYEASDRGQPITRDEIFEQMSPINQATMAKDYPNLFPNLQPDDAARAQQHIKGMLPGMLTAQQTGLLANDGRSLDERVADATYQHMKAMNDVADERRFKRYESEVEAEANKILSEHPEWGDSAEAYDMANSLAAKVITQRARSRGRANMLPPAMRTLESPNATEAQPPVAPQQQSAAPTAAAPQVAAQEPQDLMAMAAQRGVGGNTNTGKLDLSVPKVGAVAADSDVNKSGDVARLINVPKDLAVPTNVRSDPAMLRRFVANEVIKRVTEYADENQSRFRSSGASGVPVQLLTADDLAAFADSKIPGFDLDGFADEAPVEAERILQKLKKLAKSQGR